MRVLMADHVWTDQELEVRDVLNSLWAQHGPEKFKTLEALAVEVGAADIAFMCRDCGSAVCSTTLALEAIVQYIESALRTARFIWVRADKSGKPVSEEEAIKRGLATLLVDMEAQLMEYQSHNGESLQDWDSAVMAALWY